MMTERQQAELVAKLLQLTQKRKITWQRADKNPAEPWKDAFETNANGQNLRLEYTALFDRDDPDALLFVDEHGAVLWHFTGPEVRDLLRTVQYVARGMDERVSKILQMS